MSIRELFRLSSTNSSSLLKQPRLHKKMLTRITERFWQRTRLRMSLSKVWRQLKTSTKRRTCLQRRFESSKKILMRCWTDDVTRDRRISTCTATCISLHSRRLKLEQLVTLDEFPLTLRLLYLGPILGPICPACARTSFQRVLFSILIEF